MNEVRTSTNFTSNWATPPYWDLKLGLMWKRLDQTQIESPLWLKWQPELCFTKHPFQNQRFFYRLEQGWMNTFQNVLILLEVSSLEAHETDIYLKSWTFKNVDWSDLNWIHRTALLLQSEQNVSVSVRLGWACGTVRLPHGGHAHRVFDRVAVHRERDGRGGSG